MITPSYKIKIRRDDSQRQLPSKESVTNKNGEIHRCEIEGKNYGGTEIYTEEKWRGNER
jgi:hypothetical protein